MKRALLSIISFECLLPLLLSVAFIPSARGLDGPLTSRADGSGKPRRSREISVHKITKVADGGQSVSWSPSGDTLLIGRRAGTRYFNIFSVDLSGSDPRPLMIGNPKLRSNQHKGTPAWHPDGKHFVMTAQNRGSTSYRLSIPGTGLNCNLWLSNMEAQRFWQLTRVGTSSSKPQGVVYPVFSDDGSKLLWSGNTGEYPSDSLWGRKAMFVADLQLKKGGPSLGKVRTLQPGERGDFVEGHDFSPNGGSILFSGNLAPKHPLFGMDLYSMELATERYTNLTDSPNVWDEFASYSPDGRKIVWMSSTGQRVRYVGVNADKWQRFLRSELWIMNANGKDALQLTFFNSPSDDVSRELAFTVPPRGLRFLGRRCFVGHSRWSPDGSKIALILNVEGPNLRVASYVVVLELGLGDLRSAPARPTEDQETDADGATGPRSLPRVRPGPRPAIPGRF